MKAKIFILIALLFGLSSAYCQIDLSKEYAQEKEEVKEALKEIEQSIRNNETDKLISMHAYGPKFTEFLGSITEVEKWDWEDLEIHIYGGDVANVTFHSNFKFDRGEEAYDLKMQGTLLFIKTSDGWKITHEHMAPLAENTP